MNLVDPYINNITGITENFRFFNGELTSLEAKSNNLNKKLTRQYIKDQGEPHLNFIKQLFPSPAGILSIEGEGGFKSECNSDAKLFADIICHIYNKVRKNREQAIGYLDILSNITEQSDIRYVPLSTVLHKSPTNKNNKYIIKVLQNFLPLDNFIIKSDNTSDEKQYKLIDNFDKCFKGVLRLLSSGTKMLEQEIPFSEDLKQGKFLPKYTVEKMLLSYFLEGQENEKANNSIDAFYRRISQELNITSEYNDNYEEKLKKSITDLKNSNEILKNVQYNNNSPYKNETKPNSISYAISEVDKNGNVYFQNKLFQGYADTTVRHIINLLCYNKYNQWYNLFPKTSEELK